MARSAVVAAVEVVVVVVGVEVQMLDPTPRTRLPSKPGKAVEGVPVTLHPSNRCHLPLTQTALSRRTPLNHLRKKTACDRIEKDAGRSKMCRRHEMEIVFLVNHLCSSRTALFFCTILHSVTFTSSVPCPLLALSLSYYAPQSFVA